MDSTIRDRHLIDRYLLGELSGIELDNFSRQLESDAALRQEVEFRRLVYQAVEHARQQRLHEIIQQSIRYKKEAVPWGLKLILSFFFVTSLGVTLWFYLGNESVGTERTKWFPFLQKPETKSVTEQREISRTRSENRAKVLSTDTLTSDSAQASETTTADSVNVTEGPPLAVADSMPPVLEEDIIVKQDQMLISATLPINEKMESPEPEKKKEESLADEAVQKLGPASDLPSVEPQAAASLPVEFWVSPINYRGYKLIKNKLILFGIEEPDAVKLFRVGEDLYMTYMKETYKLNPSQDFTSYIKLKESEIPLALK